VEAGRTETDDTCFTDEALALQQSYEYRVRAFREVQDGETVFSSPTAVAEITVTGVAWIRVTSPAAGEVLTPGEPYVITWEANEVDQIYIELSHDSGRTYPDVVTPTGGVYDNTEGWGNYEWTVPAELSGDQFIIRITEYTEPISGYSPLFSIGGTGLARPAERPGGKGLGLEYCGRSGLRVRFAPRKPGGEVWVYRLDGRRLVYRRHNGEQSLVLPLAAFGTGVYCVRAAQGAEFAARRIIIEQ
jgi:hypothetical protein